MKRLDVGSLFLLLTTTFLLSQSNPVPLINPSARVAPPRVESSIDVSQADPKAQARILDTYGKLPLSFEANHGQADARVKFISRTGGYALFLTGDEAVLALRGKKAKSNFPVETRLAASPVEAESKSGPTPESATGAVLRMKLRNANPAARITGTDELAVTSNYFVGNDPTKWRTNVPTYAKVKYEGIYSGIDLVYYGNQHELEYDFIVAPGADPRRIAFEVRGAKRIRGDSHGDLVLKMATGEDEIRWHKPVVYQEKNGARQEITASYAITDTNRVGFELAKYDASRPLYIDPLIYSTYLGGSGSDYGYGIAVDSVGNAYITGFTASTDFPTRNPLQAANGGGLSDAFVTKINPAGSALLYSTYLGGSGPDAGIGIAVDGAGNAYIVGNTCSTDFPTMDPLQTAYGGGCPNANSSTGDAFVTKINPTGSALVYSTYLGGIGVEGSLGIAVDSAGSAYVTGVTTSTNFPTTPGAFQTICNGGVNGCSGVGDAFVAKLNPSGSALGYSTYLGGGEHDFGFAIAVDSAGNAYVTGETDSPDFPMMNPLQAASGGWDAFVSKFNPAGSALVYSTYLGGSGSDAGFSIALDSAGDAYVTGYTDSTNFPTMNPLQRHKGGNYDAFVSRFNPAGSALVYSTYLGGNGNDVGFGIAVDSAGSAYVTGVTTSGNFPTTPGAFKRACGLNCGAGQAFVSKLSPTGSAFASSTFLGGNNGQGIGYGIAVDSANNAYVTGLTGSTNFPTMNPLQSALGGTYDAFVTKIDVRAVPTIMLSSSQNPSTYGQAVNFTAVLTSGGGAPPDGETVAFKKGTTVLGTGTLSGGSAGFTTSALPAGTNYIKAAYGGDSNFAPSTSKPASQLVNKATTTTALASSQNPSNFGQSVTFTASVTPQFSGTVKGPVTFYDGTTALKTVYLSGGVAKYTTSTLTSGSHSITATYNGNTNFIGSSASLTQTVK
jgi:hypothetical protein